MIPSGAVLARRGVPVEVVAFYRRSVWAGCKLLEEASGTPESRAAEEVLALVPRCFWLAVDSVAGLNPNRSERLEELARILLFRGAGLPWRSIAARRRGFASLARKVRDFRLDLLDDPSAAHLTVADLVSAAERGDPRGWLHRERSVPSTRLTDVLDALAIALEDDLVRAPMEPERSEATPPRLNDEHLEARHLCRQIMIWFDDCEADLSSRLAVDLLTALFRDLDGVRARTIHRRAAESLCKFKRTKLGSCREREKIAE